MRITRITKENERGFARFFPEFPEVKEEQLLRIGVTDDAANAAGAAMAEVNTGFLELMYFVIASSYRRQGYGRALLQVLLGLTDTEAVSVTFPEDTALCRFFAAEGFELFESAGQFSFTLQDLLHSPLCRKLIIGQEETECREVSRLTQEEKVLLSRYLENRKMPFEGWYDPEWSSVRVTDTGLKSVFLTRKGKGGVALIWMHSTEPSMDGPIRHMRLLMKKVMAKNTSGENPTFRLSAENSRLLGNLASLLGGASHLNFEGRFIQGIYVPEKGKEMKIV